MNALGHRLRRAYRKALWQIVRGGPGRTSRILTVPTENGLLSFSNMDSMNAKGLFVQRAWEIELIHRSVRALRAEGFPRHPSADVMLDAGANIGMICIAMLKHGYFREAIAVEPGPANLELLRRNIAQNRMEPSIRVVPAALSSEAGEGEFELSAENFGDHRVRAPGAHAVALMNEERRATVRVPLQTIDRLLAEDLEIDPRRIGLLWVDVQGHEGRLFLGARETLSHGVPVVTEFWPYGIARSGIDRAEYVGILRSFFSRYQLLDRGDAALESREIGTIESLFTDLPGPDEHVQLLLLPR